MAMATAPPYLAPGGRMQPQWQPTAMDQPLEGFQKGEQDAPEGSAVPLKLPDAVPIPGYEGVGWNPALQQQQQAGGAPPAPNLPPPSYNEVIREEEKPREEYSQSQAISQEEVREALVQYVGEHCCYGKSAAEGMRFEKIEPSNALHYTLETYTEGRITAWTAVPYSGQPIDGPQYGQPPTPWDIPCKPKTLFANELYKVEVPHTASVQPCATCQCMGHVTCWTCHGWGSRRCTSCHGSGTTGMGDNRRSCTWCHGRGRRRCLECHGSGRVTCQLCQGFTRVKSYIELSVNFVNHVEDFIDEHTDLPDNLVKDVNGETVLSHAYSRVFPLQSYPVAAINQASQRLLAGHSQQWPMERIIHQRQTLRSIPVSEIHCKYKGDNGRFWVYGKEHKVHYPDYPQQCCWGCTIL